MRTTAASQWVLRARMAIAAGTAAAATMRQGIMAQTISAMRLWRRPGSLSLTARVLQSDKNIVPKTAAAMNAQAMRTMTRMSHSTGANERR